MKITFTALNIKFSAIVKYTPGTPAVPMRNGEPGDPPEAADIEILFLSHTEKGRKDAFGHPINRTYDCIYLLGAPDAVVDEIMEAAELAAEEEIKRHYDQTQIDRAEARSADWSAA
jgi:hypothetical protein